MSHAVERTVLQLAKEKGIPRAKVAYRVAAPNGRSFLYLIEGQDGRRYWWEVAE
jgi:hypothetical protein